MGFLNGLSAAGAAVGQYAAAAGLEAQKADLAKQSLILADQLATTRESAGRQEAGQIAAAAQASQQQFQAGQTQITEAGATARSAANNATSLGVANISADSAANVESQRAASNERIATQSDAGADRRNAASNQTQLDIERQRTTSAENISTAHITADGQRLADQLAVTGADIGTDSKTGNAIRIDKATGKVTPIMGPDGTPLQMPNSEAVKGLTSAMNTTNEELRNLNLQRNTDVRQAQDELDKASQRSDLFGDAKDQAIAAARKKVADVQKQYEAPLEALRARQAAATSSLLSLTNRGTEPPPAPAGRPPLSTFYGSNSGGGLINNNRGAQ